MFFPSYQDLRNRELYPFLLYALCFPLCAIFTDPELFPGYDMK